MSQCHDFKKVRYFTKSRRIKYEAYRVLHPVLYICRASSRNRLVQSFRNLNRRGSFERI